jgi:uncharacterized RDD family membrane protein YckC
MYCPNCGNAITDPVTVGHRFCAKCGANLDAPGLAPATRTPGSSATAAAPEAPYSGFWRRVWARLIDGVVFYVAFVAVIVVVAAVAGKTGGLGGRGVVVVATLAAFLLAPWLYHALMESSSVQATVGKLAAGIKVTDEAGRRTTFGRATGRYFAHMLTGLTLGVGYAMVVFTRRRQALHDMIAGSLVVRREYSPEYIEAAGPASRVSPVLATFAVLGMVLLGPFGVGILAAIAIPAYQDYTIRSQVFEGLNAATPYRAAVTESILQGQPPSALNSEQMQLPEASQSVYVRSIRVVSGIIEITYGGSANKLISGKRVLLVPATAGGGRSVAWACGHHAPPDGFTPLITKDLSEYTTVADRLLPMACRPGG